MAQYRNKILNFFSYFINLKMATAGAIIMGGIIYAINAEHGFLPAMTAALKQAIYTFFMGGALIRLLEYIVTGFNNKLLAILLAIIIPSIVTIIMVYGVHSMKGTPEPFNSTIPTILMAPPGFLVVAVRKRKLFDRETQRKLHSI